MIRNLEKLVRRTRKRSAGRKTRTGSSPSLDSQRIPRVDWRKVGSVSLIIAALSIIMSVQLLPNSVSLQLGDVAPRDIRAERSVRYFDTLATSRAEDAARLDTRPVYDSDDAALAGARRTVEEIFDRIDRARKTLPTPIVHRGNGARHGTKTVVAAASPAPQTLGAEFSPSQLQYLMNLPPAFFEKLRATTVRLVNSAMDREIRDAPSDIRATTQSIEASAHDDFSSSRDTTIVRMIAAQALRPNRILNPRRTEAARDAAARAVPAVYQPIVRGDKVIGAGEVVTREHLNRLIALGMLNGRMQASTGVAVGLLAAAMVFLVAFYIARTLPALYGNSRRLALLAVITFLSVFGLKVGGTLLGLDFSGGQLGYLGMMSVAAAGMLISVLLDMHLAVLMTALLAVLSGLLMDHEIRFAVMALMSSLVGILAAGKGRAKINLLRVTAALSAANLGLVWALGTLLHDNVREMLTGSAWAVAAALFATFLFWFGVLALEKPFGILTHATLLDLSTFDRPLLQQLCALAPGTYAHSMMVGTLAEAGAQAIGADALLCRVSGYYHDIGKMKRPDFFVENQRHENIHGRLSPSLSALIITAHVRDGVDMARENKLPADIIDIIAQHHGTTLIRYFYHQALMDSATGATPSPGLEERFRYPGPKPRTREAAVVMLADAVEAAARSLDRPSAERVEALVQTIVREKMEDGQFDECDLTFRCVRGITDAFLHVLKAMMHGRIDYPELPATGTGRPMEVVRPDLRPEPEAIDTEKLPDVGEGAALLTLSDAERDSDRLELSARMGLPNGIALAPLGAEQTVANSQSNDAQSFSTLIGVTLPITEPEVLYGRLTIERGDAEGPDGRASAGGAPPADRGGSAPGRG